MVKLEQLSAVALIFIIAGITLGIGGEIFGETGKKFDTASVVNESNTFVNNTPKALGHAPIVSINVVSNATDIHPNAGTGATAVTWTLNHAKDHVTIITNATYNALVWNFTYTHRDTESYRMLRNSSEGIMELGSWLPTIGMTIAAAIIIGLIFMAFMKKSEI